MSLPGSSQSSALASNAHRSGCPRIRQSNRSHPASSVRYILNPQVPPRRPLGPSDLYIVTSEGHLVEDLKPQQAQHFVPPRNCPWWEVLLCCTFLVIGWSVAPCQQPAVYTSPSVQLLVGPLDLRYVTLVTSKSPICHTMYLWSDKEISSDTCPLLTRSLTLSVFSV
jgi:hypothetical protein